MINKSVFEQDLIIGMQQELRKQASSETPNLVRAGECLHAALEILEEEGLQAQADQLLELMRKIAISAKTRPLQKMPTMQTLHEMGITDEDIKNFHQGQHHAKVKMNSLLRLMGLSNDEVAGFIGQHNVIPAEEVSKYIKLLDMIKHPTKALEEPETITMQRVEPPPAAEEEKPEDKETLSFQTLANKPGRPDKINDVHTKKLTPEKMVANLKHHGTEFNMPDLGWADFDPELAEALDAQNADELSVDDDSWNWDLDLSSDILDADQPPALEDFEDEVSSPMQAKATKHERKIAPWDPELEDSDAYLQKVLEAGEITGPEWDQQHPGESREDYLQRLEDEAEIFSPFRNP